MSNQVRVIGTSLNRQVNDGYDDTDVPAAPAQPVTYRCHDGHETTVRLAIDAEVPDLWECRTCSQSASHSGAAPEGEFLPEGRKAHVPRSHWDQLIARRTIPELEALLEERLQLLRARRAGRSVA